MLYYQIKSETNNPLFKKPCKGFIAVSPNGISIKGLLVIDRHVPIIFQLFVHKIGALNFLPYSTLFDMEYR